MTIPSRRRLLQHGLGGGVGHDIALEGSQGNPVLQLEAAAVVAEDVDIAHLHIVRGLITLEEEHARVERLGGAGGLDGGVGAGAGLSRLLGLVNLSRYVY